MQTAVWKYPLSLPLEGAQVCIRMPFAARILCVQVQNGVPCLWAIVQPKEELVERVFDIVGTGAAIPPTARHYIGTVQLGGGALVLHVFEDAASNYASAR